MPKKEKFRELEVHTFKNYAAFKKWLGKNFENESGIWVRFAKKRSELKTTSYEDAREVAIIFGWIDGQIYKYDDNSYLRKFTPRRKRSMWSKINRGIVERLINEKKMAPSGLAEVKAAKKDGRWEAAYDSPATIKVPKDFETLLKRNPAAKKAFSVLDKTNRYSILVRLQMAKRAATREKRMAEYIELLKNGKVMHPDRSGKKKKTRWIVLLRGINVGGKNVVKMADLRSKLETKTKFQDVETYIQSGNVILSSEKTAENIERNIKKLFKDEWGFNVPCQVLDVKELKKIVKNNPFGDKNAKHVCVTRFSKKLTAKDGKLIRERAKDGEETVLNSNLVYLYLPAGYSKTKLVNGWFEKTFDVAATSRNWNTVNKLLSMTQ